MEQAAVPAPDPALVQQDLVVKEIISEIDAAAQAASGAYVLPLARAVGMLRASSLAPTAQRLRPSQKDGLLKSINDLYGALYRGMADELDRKELTMSLSSAAHLARVWGGELSPVAAPAIDAADFVLAYELGLCQLLVLSRLSERGRTLRTGREEVIATLLAPAAQPDEPKEL